jgi:hypothetical protein
MILEENNIQEDRGTDRKSSLNIDLLTGLKHSVIFKEEDEAFRMYLYTRTYSKMGGIAGVLT